MQNSNFKSKISQVGFEPGSVEDVSWLNNRECVALTAKPPRLDFCPLFVVAVVVDIFK